MVGTEAQARRSLKGTQFTWDKELKDPRQDVNRKHRHHALLGLMAGAFACGRVCLRRVEDFGSDLSVPAKRRLGLTSGPSDSALYRLLEKQSPKGMRETVYAQVREMLDDGLIEHDLFTEGVLAIDGKVCWKSTITDVEGCKISIDDRAEMITYTLMAVRAVLVSSRARPCLDQEVIGEKAGEAPAFRLMFPRLLKAFRDLFKIVTGDAGLCCKQDAQMVVDAGKDYAFSLKGNQATLEEKAMDLFATRAGLILAQSQEARSGTVLTRELQAVTIADDDQVDFPGARQFWRVTQRACVGTLEVNREVRHFITSLDASTLGAENALKLVRLHWGIENGHNWTLDVALTEDDVAPCQQSKDAIEVVGWLRILGYNLLSAVRAQAPMRDRLPQSWQRTMELLRDALCMNRKLSVRVPVTSA